MAKLIALLVLTGIWLSPLLLHFIRDIKTPLRVLWNVSFLFVFPLLFVFAVLIGLILTTWRNGIDSSSFGQYIAVSSGAFADWFAYWFTLPFLLFAVGNIVDLIFPKKHIQGCLPEVLTLLLCLFGVLWLPAWLTGMGVSDVLFNRVVLFDPFSSPLRFSALWGRINSMIFTYTGLERWSSVFTGLILYGGFFQGFEYLIRMGGKVKSSWEQFLTL
ncbi:MAG: hypothetical protein HPY45_00665 [Anaerolineae bacterium]|nr:hypothetical protein [Anaerolineae bacterium]